MAIEYRKPSKNKVVSVKRDAMMQQISQQHGVFLKLSAHVAAAIQSGKMFSTPVPADLKVKMHKRKLRVG